MGALMETFLSLYVIFKATSNQHGCHNILQQQIILFSSTKKHTDVVQHQMTRPPQSSNLNVVKMLWSDRKEAEH